MCFGLASAVTAAFPILVQRGATTDAVLHPCLPFTSAPYTALPLPQHTRPLNGQRAFLVFSMPSKGLLQPLTLSVPFITLAHTWRIARTMPHCSSPNCRIFRRSSLLQPSSHLLPLSPTPPDTFLQCGLAPPRLGSGPLWQWAPCQAPNQTAVEKAPVINGPEPFVLCGASDNRPSWTTAVDACSRHYWPWMILGVEYGITRGQDSWGMQSQSVDTQVRKDVTAPT
jgi:hypothetical protein